MNRCDIHQATSLAPQGAAGDWHSSAAIMAYDNRVIHNPSPLRRLGAWWVVYGIICLTTAVVMGVYSGTATVMFGALLARVPDPFTLMSLFHVVYAVMAVLSVICGVLGLVGGLALLRGQRSGRTFALIAGFLSLWRIPVGITLGVYTLAVLLPLNASHHEAQG